MFIGLSDYRNKYVLFIHTVTHIYFYRLYSNTCKILKNVLLYKKNITE